jgi:hypothetical protein
MKLSDLVNAGAFVSEVPIKKTVIWKHEDKEGKPVEHTFDVYVRKQSFGSIEVIYGTETDRSKMSKYISESICDEKGSPVIPYERANALEPDLGMLLIGVINDVNGIGKGQAKN